MNIKTNAIIQIIIHSYECPNIIEKPLNPTGKWKIKYDSSNWKNKYVLYIEHKNWFTYEWIHESDIEFINYGEHIENCKN